MFLPETTNLVIGNVDVSIADWPTDTWGNPYAVYLVVGDSSAVLSNNPLGLRLINNPTEDPSFMAAVVSYGPNGVPGGNDLTVNADPGFFQTLQNARLYLTPSESAATPPGAEFTLRSVSGLTFDSSFVTSFPESIHASNLDPNTGRVGMLDTGTDDIVWKF